MKGFQFPTESHPLPEAASGETRSAWREKDNFQPKLLPKSLQFSRGCSPAIIREATLNDLRPLYKLYKIVARFNRGNLTQEEEEITLEYVSEMLNEGLERGLVLVIEEGGEIVGYLKAFTSRFKCLAHVLTNATMMVHPEWQGKGYGGQLIDAYLREITANMPHILRFELLPHQSNPRAIEFYERHGFARESIASQKIRKPRGNFDSEVTLVWFNPNFSEEGLKRYHAFLSRPIP
ncbi:GNAT family N-acetyltransferase [Pannus brasiliensis CCIBt3594]|uniref:GNAT family N-acetyltransferase n=1 Tax=Pannus brasiliensis CCIBt3594 TaxID=1427578 RepID=A0AAW9QN69_9CHRO